MKALGCGWDQVKMVSKVIKREEKLGVGREKDLKLRGDQGRA